MLLRAAIVLVGLALFAGNATAQTSAASAFTFSPAGYASDAGARGIVSDDFDNDGSPDFATANAGTNTVDVFMNREFTGGGFQVKRIAVGAGPFDITSADFNYDGYADLVVAAADANEIDVLFGDVGGNFKAPMRIPVSGNPRGVAAGYLGFSGYSIVYSSYTSGTISFLDYDYSSGTFLRGITLNAGANPQGIVIGYLKPVGCGPDIAVANAGGSPITLLQRNCDGTFTHADLTAPSGSGGTNMNVLVVADFNKDNRLDLAAASTSANYVAIYLNSTTGLHWTANLGGGTVSSPRGIAAADLNLDGRQDLIVASRTSSSVTIFTAGNSATVFSTHQIVKSASGSRTVVAADFDGDGRVDLATGNEYAGAGTVYQIGTTSALSVNLEECSGCGLSGWGWRDEAWGSRGAVGTATLRFPRSTNGAWHRMRIQTREDGVMIDQIVLSSVKYKTTRPGAVKNDTTILWSTIPED